MKEMHFSFIIQAPRAVVWNTLWHDVTFRDWAGLIDPGTYMTGELVKSQEVQYISAENGYGVTSLVAEVTTGEYLLLQHQADTQDSGARERDKEWTGGTESYALVENNGITTLTVIVDVPQQMEAYFAEAYPKAFERVKDLAEKVSS